MSRVGDSDTVSIATLKYGAQVQTQHALRSGQPVHVVLQGWVGNGVSSLGHPAPVPMLSSLSDPAVQYYSLINIAIDFVWPTIEKTEFDHLLDSALGSPLNPYRDQYQETL